MLSILRKERLRAKEMRVLMLGLDNGGKTTIVKRLLGKDISTISPTLGFSIESVYIKGHTLNIWDVGGQKTLRSYWKNYFEKTDAVIWVVDAHDPIRMKECARELHTLLQHEPLAGASALIFLNKTELDGCLDNEEISAVPGFPHQQCSLKPALIVAQILQLDAIETHEFRMIRCSAKENQGLQEGMEWVVDAIKTKNFLY